MTNTHPIYCSRSKCKQPAVVTRWYVEIDHYHSMMVHLCLDCKKIPPWEEENDVIKEETSRRESPWNRIEKLTLIMTVTGVISLVAFMYSILK